MADMAEAPCWPVSYAECAECPELGSSPDQPIYEKMAAAYLWAWTGRRFGTAPLAVRPCLGGCTRVATFWGSGPYPSASSAPSQPPIAVAVACGVCRREECSCGMLNSVALPGPVASVESVRVDGAELPPDSYVVYDWRFLLRTDGGSWPRCQDLSLPLTEEGTWQVEYTRGIPVPEGGQIAAALLACEIAKAVCDSPSCKLPKRLQAITRQGVTVALLDPFEGLEQGRTGIWVVDSWVASVNVRPSGGTVMSPDVRRTFRRLTWAPGGG